MEICEKNIGRINIDVEKKMNLTLSGDTYVYVSMDDFNELQNKYGKNIERLFDYFRSVLKKPNFVRTSDNQTDFIYLSIVLKNSELLPYKIHFIREKDRFFLKDFGFISLNDLKIYDSIVSFTKIN